MNMQDFTNFSTFSFLIFLLVSLVIFWLLPQKLRQSFLLFVSYIFYSSYHFSHVLLLFFTTLIDFYLGQIIFRQLQEKKKITHYVFICLLANLGVLFFFKYQLFFSFKSLLFPLGISFFTLQSIGYILDISRGKLIPEKNFITYALFVSFFPQIIAGPIEKARDIIPQYKKTSFFKDINWSKVFYLFSYGFIKKYIVADNIAWVLSDISIRPESSYYLKYITLVFFFIRIYCDFSGYTNMAQAIALLFGLRLSENFNFPLFAKSPQDFWDRWHMSLGRWVKNYFFTPLLIFTSNPYLSLLIVFPIMGLWHGANPNFLLWGFSWGFLIIMIKKIQTFNLFKKIPRMLQFFFMFNTSAILMVFYKARNFTELKNYFTFNPLRTHLSANDDFYLVSSIFFLPVFVLCYEFLLFIKNDYFYILKRSFVVKVSFYLFLVFLYRYFSGVAAEQVFYLQF